MFVAPELPEGKINISDPDSRVMRTAGTPPRQAYNAQAAVNDQQVILAAEITNAAADFGQLAPTFNATIRNLAEQGVTDTRRCCSLTPATASPPDASDQRTASRGARPT